MALTNDQKVYYLSNVIFLARADGKLSPKESDTILKVQKKLGARKSDLNKAHKQAENADFKIVPIGHFVDKVQNLEDLIYISLVDGTLDDTEKPLVIEFAKKINISNEQLNLVVSDVKNLLSSESGSTSCPRCGEKIKNSAKFCPECGTSISEAIEEKSIPVSYDIPNKGIAIEFAESTASGFAHAVRDQKSAPINTTCLKGKKIWYLAAWPVEDISKTSKLIENLKGMRNRKVYIDGEESRWDEVFGFAWCFEERNSAYRPIEYCFGLEEKRLNLWGCKQARMDWTEWADWLGYGSFKNKGIIRDQTSFVFDKKRIRHELETNLFRCRFCPQLRFDLIEAVLEELPDEVTPSEKGPWVYKRDYTESPGAIKIKVKIVNDEYSYTEEYYSSGVAPNSVDLGLNLLKKAFEKCGFKEAEMQGVLDFKGVE